MARARIGGALKLHCLVVQPGNAGSERIQAAAVALQVFTEAGDDFAQVGECAAPCCDGGALSRDGIVQLDECAP